jgi:hypothetical protein
MHRLFLLRAYGDFVILIQALIQSPPKNKYTLIVSQHLEPLYKELALVIDLSSIPIQFVNFGINTSQLRLFTNKHLLSVATFKELKQIRKFVEQNPNTTGQDYIEQGTRISAVNFLTGLAFKPMINKQLVYTNYDHFFKNTGPKHYEMKQLDNVLILPDARLQKRVLNLDIIEAIQNYYTQKAVKTSIARFKHTIEKDDIIYTNFKDLIMCIQKANFIIAADSLPIHLAQLLNKPHFMLFPNGHPRNFITPYALEYNSYGEFSNFKLPF